MKMLLRRSLFISSLLASTAMGSPLGEELEKRQATTAVSAMQAAETDPGNAPLVETTIDGKVTTVPVALPSATTTTTGGSKATTTAGGSAETGTTTNPAVPTSTAGACTNSIDQPICEPRENQTLYVGNTYYSESLLSPRKDANGDEFHGHLLPSQTTPPSTLVCNPLSTVP
jgi:hypothetical protein